ncbi:DUF1266 domain-containing protein [Chitinophaga sp. 212800008-4]|uniref:DUF1266 domain-containing protein n=1 Tax=unclassified Chitinophaga TaxID=2619133 RepID=UPI0030CD76DC
MNKAILFSATIAAAMAFTACGDGGKKAGGDSAATASSSSSNASAPKDDKLSGFMLGGIYFINGYGGQAEVSKMITSTEKADIINDYKQLLEFPFKTDDAAGAKNTLKEWWSINDKAGLEKNLDELTKGKPDSKHRAWDYARLVNNACMGYAAGYLTKEEAEKYVAAALPLARKDYKTWDDYFADWMEGRKAWGGDESHAKEFEDLSKSITKGDHNIYQILPLN